MSPRTLNFFFDVDGTLLPFGLDVPESAKEAIEDLKRRGHRVFLSSGRSVAELNRSVSDIGFDGGVFSSGANVIYRGKSIFKTHIPSSDVESLLDYSASNNLFLIAQGDGKTYLTRETGELFNSMVLRYVGRLLDIPNIEVVDALSLSISYNKFLFLSPNGDVDRVRKELSPSFNVVDNTVGLPSSLMAEIVLKDVTKATGIERIIEYLGEERSSVVAFGDGANDIEMIEYAYYGVAMGSSPASLKEKSDFVSDDVLHDGLKKGIYRALKDLLGES